MASAQQQHTIQQPAIPTFIFGPNATKAHESDHLAKQCISQSIKLAERLMAIDSYIFILKQFNKNLKKCSEMLLETEVQYFNFNTYQELEKKERETYTDETEADGNGLSDEVMKEARVAESEWKKQESKLPKPEISSELDKDTPLAWTRRRTGNHSKTIFINETFIERIKKNNIEPNSFEWNVIVVAQAFAIIHETGHLSLRWKGIIHSPSIINEEEAGNSLETKFLDFNFSILVVRPLIKDQEGQREAWNYQQEIKGIGVHLTSFKVVRKVKDDYINKVCKSVLEKDSSFNDDSTFYPISTTRGAHGLKDVTPTKGSDEFGAGSLTNSSSDEDEKEYFFDGNTKLWPVRRTCAFK